MAVRKQKRLPGCQTWSGHWCLQNHCASGRPFNLSAQRQLGLVPNDRLRQARHELVQVRHKLRVLCEVSAENALFPYSL